MPTVRVAPDLEMHYLVDDYTDPWRTPETVLLLHGNAESGRVWFGWVPHLARDFQVVRPDLRGYGDSTPMPRDYAWSIDVVVDDCLSLMDELGVDRFHLVGAKIGGTFARRLAARCPDRVRTLTLAGVPGPRRNMGPGYAARATEFETQGVEHWARRTIGGRLRIHLPARGRGVVDTRDGAHGGVDAGRLHRVLQSVGHFGRPAAHRLPDAGHQHGGQRAGLGGRNPRVAATDTRLAPADAGR
jgi:pimeloyl-ACP methyl ester carboxylesterase